MSAAGKVANELFLALSALVLLGSQEGKPRSRDCTRSMFAASATSDAIEAPRLRSHNPTTSIATGCSTLQNRLIYADFIAGGCSPLLRVALWVVSRVMSNGIVNHYGCPPCCTEYLIRRDDNVQDLVRAVEITLVSQREKRFYSTSPQAVHL
jgi:hypothetical protein